MKVGDKILHKSKDALVHKYTGTIIQSNFDNSTYLILWDKQLWNTGSYESWMLSHEIVLDITQIRNDKLNQLL